MNLTKNFLTSASILLFVNQPVFSMHSEDGANSQRTTVYQRPGTVFKEATLEVIKKTTGPRSETHSLQNLEDQSPATVECVTPEALVHFGGLETSTGKMIYFFRIVPNSKGITSDLESISRFSPSQNDPVCAVVSFQCKLSNRELRVSEQSITDETGCSVVAAGLHALVTKSKLPVSPMGNTVSIYGTNECVLEEISKKFLGWRTDSIVKGTGLSYAWKMVLSPKQDAPEV